MPPSPAPEPIEQIRELNRLFLRALQDRDKRTLVRSGFPPGAVQALRRADAEQLEATADFPRALFELVIDKPPTGGVRAGHEPGVNSSNVLELTIGYCAWSTSRESAYHARLFFGLSSEVIHTLRTTPLSRLPHFVLAATRVECAFREAESLWRELLLETRPEARRQLVLVALQPPLQASGAFGRTAARRMGSA